MIWRIALVKDFSRPQAATRTAIGEMAHRRSQFGGLFASTAQRSIGQRSTNDYCLLQVARIATNVSEGARSSGTNLEGSGTLGGGGTARARVTKLRIERPTMSRFQIWCPLVLKWSISNATGCKRRNTQRIRTERFCQFASFVDRTPSLRPAVTTDAARERKLSKELVHATSVSAAASGLPSAGDSP